MSRAVSRKAVIDKIIAGSEEAFTKYKEWSGGEWLHSAPESFLQVYVAASLSEFGLLVFLERTIKKVMSDAKVELRGCKPRNSPSGRADIVLANAKTEPRFIIELKHAWHVQKIDADAKRLQQMVDKGGSIEYGILVVYTTAKSTGTITDLFETIEDNYACCLEGRVGPVHDSEEDWHWDIGCFVFRRQ